jgi:hypothetical protein
MKRFVIFLPLVVLSSFKAADSLVGSIPLSSIQLTNAQQTNDNSNEKQELLSFEQSSFYTQARPSTVAAFINYIKSDDVDIKLVKEDWQQINLCRENIFPCLTLQGKSGKSVQSKIVKLKEGATVLFDRDGRGKTSYHHVVPKESPLYKNKIRTIDANITENSDVLLKLGKPAGNITKNEELTIGDPTKDTKDVKKVTAIFLEPSQCHLWLGFEKGQVYCYKILSNEFVNYTNPMQNNDISALGLIGNNKLLITASSKQLLLTDIQRKHARLRIFPQDSWTKSYITDNHIIFTEQGWTGSHGTYFTVPCHYGLGVGLESAKELAYLWAMYRLKYGLTPEIANELCPQVEENIVDKSNPYLSTNIVKASIGLNSFLLKTENIRPFDRSVGRTFKAFLKENRVALTSKK